MKTKEEKIKDLEAKVRVTNIYDYISNTNRKYSIKGTITGTVLAAIPLSISFAANVLGVDPNPLDPNGAIRVIANIFDLLDSPALAILTGTALFSCSLMDARSKAWGKMIEMSNMRYFLNNKEFITKGCPYNISILDAKDMDPVDLALYEQKGRSLVKKNTKINS